MYDDNEHEVAAVREEFVAFTCKLILHEDGDPMPSIF